MLLFYLYQLVLCRGCYGAVWFVFWRSVGDLRVLSFCFCLKFARLIMALVRFSL